MEVLNRARAHLQSLQKAEAQGKTPAKMAIAIKPMVLEKDDSRFKTEWAAAIQDAERNFSKTIQSQLTRVVNKTTDKIRTNVRQTICKLKISLDNASAKLAVKEAIREADQERWQHNQAREKTEGRKTSGSNKKKANSAP